MKLDPADVFSNAVSGVVARAALSWLAVWLGVAMATMELGSLEAFLLLPATVLFYVLWGGAWALLTFPVLCYTAYRALRFVARGEDDWAELGTLALLGAAMCLPVTKVSLPHLVLGGIALAWLASKCRSPEEDRAEQS